MPGHMVLTCDPIDALPPTADDECDCEECKALNGARFLIKNAVKGWLPELGEVYSVTLTAAQHKALLDII